MVSVLTIASECFLGLLVIFTSLASFAGFAYVFLFLLDIAASLFSKMYAKCVYKLVVKRWPSVSYIEEEEEGGGGEIGERKKKCREASSCAVCLEGFRNGDLCRLLPACSHRFHVLCIDVWIKMKPTCPICRTSVTKKAPVNDENV